MYLCEIKVQTLPHLGTHVDQHSRRNTVSEKKQGQNSQNILPEPSEDLPRLYLYKYIVLSLSLKNEAETVNVQ